VQFIVSFNLRVLHKFCEIVVILLSVLLRNMAYHYPFGIFRLVIRL